MNTQSDWQHIISACAEGVRLQVKITPGSSRDRILGPHGDSLKISVSAAPEKGKANQALITYLSKLTGLPQQHITVVSGHTSPRKVLLLAGIDRDQCLDLLQRAMAK